MNRTLWIVQILLALLFVFAGVMKFVMPAEEMMKQMPSYLSVAFIHFIGVAEIAGALGLVLPGWLKIKPWLTPLGAACLAIIMIGATVITIQTQPGPGFLFPFVTLILCVFVAYGRRRLAP